MPAPLYARYIPPKPTEFQKQQLQHTAITTTTSLARQAPAGAFDLSRKRKGSDNAILVSRKSKKHSPTEADPTNSAPTAVDSDGVSKKRQKQLKKPSIQNVGNINGTWDSSRPLGEVDGEVGDGHEGSFQNSTLRLSKKQDATSRKWQPNDDVPSDKADSQKKSGKHTGLLSKYSMAIATSAKASRNADKKNTLEGDVETAPELVNDLAQISLPKRESQDPAISAHSALPPWLGQPLHVDSCTCLTFEELGVHPDHIAKLRGKGFERALALQTGTLPLLLPRPTQHPGDLCVSAATGSGKTLAYVLPIVESLSQGQSPSLRAIIVVPTRELVSQVRETVDSFTIGTDLKVAVATGSQHLVEEQEKLVGCQYQFDYASWKSSDSNLSEDPTDLAEDEEDPENNPFEAPMRQILPPNHLLSYSLKVDILICTPGRLVEHIKRTKGFNLAQLEWLVIDEADRLLDSSFQEWVENLNAALNKKDSSILDCVLTNIFKRSPRSRLRKVVLSATMTRNLEKLAGLQLNNPRMIMLEGTERLTTGSDERHNDGPNLPSTLSERGVPVGDGSEKPLYLLSVIEDIIQGKSTAETLHMAKRKLHPGLEQSGHVDDGNESDNSSSVMSSQLSSLDSSSSKVDGSDSDLTTSDTDTPLASKADKDTTAMSATSNVLIFTATNESAHRLAHLITHMRPAYSALLSTITKSGTSRTTAKAIASFQTGKLRILIATDRASRGLDLPNLTDVINYDIPHSITSYVHRVGRTARAGKSGCAWTLVDDHQARWFWKDVAKGTAIIRGENVVHRINKRIDTMGDDERHRYTDALKLLQSEVNGSRIEADGLFQSWNHKRGREDPSYLPSEIE